ncbi:hypothetical protein GCM10011371_00520 [Novosphingobium marinum]|uniref:SMC interacting uncharacterized protein involved in chromosome segregation n=1 Tax=Novosphingobium marinum TaxID=1514948 RepID=A0A7Y9XSK1_9SPHN|nr:hypothetical protein [Novosphingobium marinum]NYH93744.1 SMC interacting uncharacterized protein involved in chromosome segregation [Novosphingobium marinum]GGC16973.1 hypothetical protein GCM10011371_00520 [Novosphingobium marinum]
MADKSKKPVTDPVAAWQGLVQQWEQEINAWSGKITETEQFSAMMGQATKYSLVAQQAFAEHMEKVLTSLNVPTKTQMEEMSERLSAIEEALERLRLSMADGPEAKSAPEPRRTRKPKNPS